MQIYIWQYEKWMDLHLSYIDEFIAFSCFEDNSVLKL